jgi:serine/threonine protein phosphatase PrpC
VPCQLTKDHKPSDSEENLRILNAGGKIERFPHSENLSMSPFRIFDPSKQLPSVSVSRAQGDFSLRRLGVSSEASIKIFPIKQDDFFIVLASDGVWDVMENEEVVAFVETFRSLCKDQLNNDLNVGLSNSCIAQLLCEEARVRWLSLMTSSDVNMDDISCVVFELRDTPEHVKTSQSCDLEGRLSTSSGFFN